MRRVVGVMAVLVCAGVAAWAQTTAYHTIYLDLEAFALIDLDDDADMDFTLALSGLPADAGLGPSATYTAARHLWYTVMSAGTAARIQASLDSNLPTGLVLELTATSGGGGGGTQGSGATIAAVDDTDRDLVTGIGSCYTGQGSADGAEVDYELSASNYIGTSISRTVTYTISGW